MNWALVNESGIVVNTVVCDTAELANELFTDYLVVNIDGMGVAIGWSYDGSSFSAPAKTPEEISAENLSTAKSEYEIASVNIEALNEQIADEDYSGTTEEAVRAELASWTDYRKQLRAYIKAGDGSKAPPVSPVS